MISLSFPFSFLFFFLALKEFFFFSKFFCLDSISFFMTSIFPMICLLLFFPYFSFSSFKEELLHFYIFGPVILFLFFCFSSMNSFLFLVFLENCVIFMFLCIVYFSKDLDKVSSSFFMFFINIFPSIMFMFFCQEWPYNLDFISFFPLESLSFLCFFSFLGLLISKLPLFSFHFWLTKAHVSASGCGSMILASLLLKLGSMGLLKFYFIFQFPFSFCSGIIFSIVTWFSIILLMVMIRFFDLKYLVACSSIIHMGPLLCLILQGSSFPLWGSCLMQVGHGLVSYFIFFLITLFYETSYHRSLDYNKSFSSASPLIYSLIFFFFLLNMGFPPFCSFLSELTFLYSFFMFDSFIMLFYSVSLIPSGIFFFFVVSKCLFGKKAHVPSQFFSSNLICFMYSFLFFFLFLPFFF